MRLASTLPLGIMTVGAAVATSGAAMAQPASFVLRGTIRDFRVDHPDFGPDLGSGHYAGNIGLRLGDDGKPVYTGAGFEVTAQWRDRLAQPIAPHMWNDGRIFVEVVTAPSLGGGTVTDSYDSDAGPYDPVTAGPAPDWITGSPMPTVTIPALTAPLSGDFLRNGSGTTTLSADLHCNNFDVRDLHIVRISGHVRIVVEGAFTMHDGAQIQLDAGAQCDIYIKGSGEIYDTIIGGPQQTHRMRIHYTGATDFRLGDASALHAHMVAPSAMLKLQDGSDFYGQVRARTVRLENSSGLHVDDLPSLCGITIDDARGTAGGAGGDITSGATFSQWFSDALGVNASRPNSIVLRDYGGGYEFSDSGGFFPIDGKLYGEDGDPHNYYFTYEIPATFTYNGCLGQTIWFEGSDDCWIFIDGRLVIDIGGVEAGTGQVIELDRLRLEDGETYTFHLFYAHRHAGPAQFGLRTNFELQPLPVESGIAMYASHD